MSDTPIQVVQTAVEQVVRVVQESDLEKPEAAAQHRDQIQRIAEHLFDFPEMARRTLAQHWKDRSAQERDEFVLLFRDTLRRTYLGRLEKYSGERIVYTGETVDGEYATVRSKIVTGGRTGPSRAAETPDHAAIGDELDRLTSIVKEERDNLRALERFLGRAMRVLAALPSRWPVRGQVNSGDGSRTSPWSAKSEFHSGLDIGAKEGTPVGPPRPAPWSSRASMPNTAKR